MTQRLIALDTETTGLDPGDGDRIIEIGMVEIGGTDNGRTWRKLLDPGDRPIPESATAVHGHTNASLAGMPKFEDIIDDFLDFLGDATLVIHNARFDVAFLTSEFERCNRLLPCNDVIDTYTLAGQEFPNSNRSLDALARRFQVDTSAREQHHGALVDALILAQVYTAWKSQSKLDLNLRSEADGGDDDKPLIFNPLKVSLPPSRHRQERAANSEDIP